MPAAAIETTLQARISSPPQADAPPLGRFYDVDGRHLALHRAGGGGPAVVFMPGAGLVGLDFLNIQNAIADRTTAVTYDRGGTGWSDAVRLPRSASVVVDELRALLQAADIPPPYILVGHSLGGAYIRRFAQRYPREVAGLLFLDPAHESYADAPAQSLFQQAKMVLRLAPALINARKFYRPMFERMLAAWPDAIRARLVDYHITHWGKSLAEAKTLQTDVFDELRGGGPMPDAPTIVLTAAGIDPFMAPFMSRAYLDDLNARKAGFYDAFARSLPRGENRLVDAGHSTLHTEKPDAVVQALHDLIDAVGR
jgi:pimeloyl-ACP methyl ester carboxylesterase